MTQRGSSPENANLPHLLLTTSMSVTQVTFSSPWVTILEFHGWKEFHSTDACRILSVLRPPQSGYIKLIRADASEVVGVKSQFVVNCPFKGP